MNAISREFSVLLISIMLFASHTFGHELDPGYLEIIELNDETYRVFWRKPDVDHKPLNIELELPKNCTTEKLYYPFYDGKAWNAEWTTRCPGGLPGKTLAIQGLKNTRTDVLLSVKLLNTQGTISARLTRNSSDFQIPITVRPKSTIRTYIQLGVDHILEGVDHLLFVFCLTVLIRSTRLLIGTITAFTFAHSITLVLASLKILYIPTPPVEAIIALSILFLSIEIAKYDEHSLRFSERYPWLIACSFGLLHGLGFAGALSDIGLPEGAVFIALVSFNIGVEIGQLLFVTAVLSMSWILSTSLPIHFEKTRTPWSQRRLVSSIVGPISCYWLFERLASFTG